jgi:hypothetical protein
MPTVPDPRPQTNGVRERKPLLPVQLLRVQCESGLADLIAGHAVLVICVGDHTDSHTTVYWLKADVDQHSGKVVSFELQQFSTGGRYHLPADLSSCDCPDHIYREERPGGCKHMVALRQALVGMVATPEGGWAGFSSDDEVIEAAVSEDDEVIDLDERWTVIEDADGNVEERWTVVLDDPDDSALAS